MIWLKPVVWRIRSSPRWLHLQPLASPLLKLGTPQDGQHRWGLLTAALAPGPSGPPPCGTAPGDGPAPLGCCLGGHECCRHSMTMVRLSSSEVCWLTRAHPAARMVWGQLMAWPPLAAQSWATLGLSYQAHTAIGPGYCGLKKAWL